jgi:gamma-glutamylcyclotransferase (GGCT)/AIG2-like uncharacterized protein YtfP
LTPGTAGGGISGGTAATPETATVAANNPVNAPGTQVTLNVHGNMYNRKEEALQIIDLLNQSFQNDGTTLVTGGV